MGVNFNLSYRQLSSSTMSSRYEEKVKQSDMSEAKLTEAIDVARKTMQEGEKSEFEMANSISSYFNAKYHPTWHCIVGKNFGAFCTAETKTFAYFYLGQTAVLIFKAG